VRRRQDAGELDLAFDPHAVASLLIAAADGLQIRWLLDPDGVDTGDRLERLWNAFKTAR
jgi:hypothetical protein